MRIYWVSGRLDPGLPALSSTFLRVGFICRQTLPSCWPDGHQQIHNYIRPLSIYDEKRNNPEMTNPEILSLVLFCPSSITFTTLKSWSPQTTQTENGGKACYQKGGWELGRQNCRCPEGSLAYKWQSLDLRQGSFNQQSRSSALSPLPLVFKISEYVMDVHGAEFRRYKVTQWKVSLLILSSCHSISFLIQPTHIPLQA